MRLKSQATLALRDLRRSARSFIGAAIGLAAGVATLTFFLGLLDGLREHVIERVMPLDVVEVIPPESAVGSVIAMLGGGGPAGIDAEQVRALRGVPGVRGVLPRMRLQFPSSGRGGQELFGRSVGAGEIPADGIDREMVQRELGPGVDFSDPSPRSSHAICQVNGDCPTGEYCDLESLPERGRPPPAGQCSKPIPALVSPYLVEVFNGVIAPAHRLPPLGDVLLRQATGLILEWDLGRAGLGGARQGTPRRVHARLVGVSPRAMELGLTIPMEVARRLNREYAGPSAARAYSSVVIYLRSPDAMTEVSRAVRSRGLEVRTRGAEQMGLLVTAIRWILALASGITVVVAALNIAHAFLSLIAERRGELGLMRALGATRSDVRRMILAEALVVGFGASVVGVFVAWVGAAGCNYFARTHLPDFPFKPEVWFVFHPTMLLSVLAFGVGSAVLSAVFPAVRASRVEPALALASGV